MTIAFTDAHSFLLAVSSENDLEPELGQTVLRDIRRCVVLSIRCALVNPDALFLPKFPQTEDG